MKVIIAALIALVVCQLAGARSVNTKEAEVDCYLDLFNRAWGDLWAYIEAVFADLADVRVVYNECLTRPQNEVGPCLNAFSESVVVYVEDLYARVMASRDVVTQYAVERLDDYYDCRVNYVQLMTGRRDLACDNALLDAAFVEFDEYIQIFLGAFYELRDSFRVCSALPVDDQADCLVPLFYRGEEIWASANAIYYDNQDTLRDLAIGLLNNYFDCRSA